MNTSGILCQKDLNCSKAKLNSSDQINQTNSSFIKEQSEMKNSIPKQKRLKGIPPIVPDRNDNKENLFNKVTTNQNDKNKTIEQGKIEQSPTPTYEVAPQIDIEIQETLSSLNICCYCGKAGEIVQICKCALSHRSCVNQKVNDEKVELIDRLRCSKCNFCYPLKGDQQFKAWQQQDHKLSLLLHSLLLFLILIFIAYGTINFVQLLKQSDDINRVRMIIGMTLFYTVSFCLSICLVNKIIDNFIIVSYKFEERSQKLQAIQQSKIEVQGYKMEAK